MVIVSEDKDEDVGDGEEVDDAYVAFDWMDEAGLVHNVDADVDAVEDDCYY